DLADVGRLADRHDTSGCTCEDTRVKLLDPRALRRAPERRRREERRGERQPQKFTARDPGWHQTCPRSRLRTKSSSCFGSASHSMAMVVTGSSGAFTGSPLKRT